IVRLRGDRVPPAARPWPLMLPEDPAGRSRDAATLASQLGRAPRLRAPAHPEPSALRSRRDPRGPDAGGPGDVVQVVAARDAGERRSARHYAGPPRDR